MSKPYYEQPGVVLYRGDCREILPFLEPTHAVVTDPPYELGFMGKEWDRSGVAFDPEAWRKCLDVLRPGGHLLAFGGSRTAHRIAVAIEEAGFEIRDTIMWLYGSGFPKSLDVSKAIDKAAGAEREIVGRRSQAVGFDLDKQGGGGWSAGEILETLPATEAAKQWQGWGTALKPAFEPIIVARKPLDGTVAGNVQKHGCGGLNIDAARIPTLDALGGGAETRTTVDQKGNEGWVRPWMSDAEKQDAHAARVRENVAKAESLGRWPANVLHDGSDEVLEIFAAYGEKASGKAGPDGHVRNQPPGNGIYGGGKGLWQEAGPAGQLYGDSGTAARFFYCAKATAEDRGGGNTHATVKPTALMEYLVRLVTPPGGTVLDPFAGSGTTAVACVKAGFRFVGVELEQTHCDIIVRRLERPHAPVVKKSASDRPLPLFTQGGA